MIIREKLKFPSGFSTAVLIGVLHGKSRETHKSSLPAGFASLAAEDDNSADDVDEGPRDQEWKANMRLLVIAFFISGFFTLVTYFVPATRSIPIFGLAAASSWLWTLNPSLACMLFLESLLISLTHNMSTSIPFLLCFAP